LSIAAVVASAIAIWGSVLGCRVACCGRPTLAVSLTSLLIVTLLPAYLYASITTELNESCDKIRRKTKAFKYETQNFYEIHH